jgi:WD40 repeat protein
VWAVEVAGHRLFSASADKTIRVWDIESRRCERVLEDHTRPVLSLACADGKLFSGSYDYSIKVGSPLVFAPRFPWCAQPATSHAFDIRSIRDQKQQHALDSRASNMPLSSKQES